MPRITAAPSTTCICAASSSPSARMSSTRPISDDLDRQAVSQIEARRGKSCSISPETGNAEGRFKPFANALGVRPSSRPRRRSSAAARPAASRPILIDLDKLLGGLHPRTSSFSPAARRWAKPPSPPILASTRPALIVRPKGPDGKTIAEDGAVVGAVPRSKCRPSSSPRVFCRKNPASRPITSARARSATRIFDKFVMAKPAPVLDPILRRRHAGAEHRRLAHPAAPPAAPARASASSSSITCRLLRGNRQRLRESRPGNLRDHRWPQGAGQRSSTCR